jgi:uncharacterized protein DUF4199
MEKNKPISHFVAGIILALILLIYSTALQFLGLGQNQSLGWLSYIILVVGLIIFINQHAKSKDYRVSFGGLFTYGFKVTAITTIIVIICLIIFFAAFPEFKQKILDMMRKGMEDGGKMSDDQIDSFVAGFSKNFLLITAGGALFMYLLCGAIGSLIGAAVTKKVPVNPLDQLPS